MKPAAVGILLALLSASCVTTTDTPSAPPAGAKAADGRPAWLVNPGMRYPESRFLVASGDGDTLRAAQNAATANLAKIFESRIQAEDNLSERYREWAKGGKSAFESESILSRRVSIQTAQDLFNIQFSPSFTAPDGRVHVLAALDRAETAAIYRQRIGENAARVRAFAQRVAGTDPLHRYAFLQRGATVALQNRMLLQQLDLISMADRKAVDLGYDADSLFTQAADAGRAIRCTVRLEGDLDRKVSVAVEEVLNDLGFSIGASPVLTVSGKVLLERTDLGRPEVFVRYDVQVQLADPAGHVIATFAEKGREGHLTQKEAEARALRVVRDQLRETLRGKVVQYFKGLTEAGG